MLPFHAVLHVVCLLLLLLAYRQHVNWNCYRIKLLCYTQIGYMLVTCVMLTSNTRESCWWHMGTSYLVAALYCTPVVKLHVKAILGITYLNDLDIMIVLHLMLYCNYWWLLFWFRQNESLHWRASKISITGKWRAVHITSTLQ